MRSTPAACAAASDRIGIGREAVGVEVAVGVDQAHGASVREPLRPAPAPRSRSRAAGTAAPARPPDRCPLPRAPGELVEDRRAAVAVRAVRVAVAELGEDARGGAGHERRDGQADQPAGLEEVAEHAAQARRGRLVAGLGRLGQDPRLLGVDRPCSPRRRTPTARPGRRAGGSPRARAGRAGACPPSPRPGATRAGRRGAGRSPSR